MKVRAKNRERTTYIIVDAHAIKAKELHRRIHGIYNRVIFNGMPASEALEEILELLAVQTGKTENVELVRELLVMAADETDEMQTGAFAVL